MKDLPPHIAQLLYGYRASRILLSAVELDLFSALSNGATAEKAARRVRASRRGVEILLHALTPLGLIKKVGKKFFNTKTTREFLAAGGKNDWRLGLGHHFGLWESWSRLTNVVKKGRPGPRPARDKNETKAFIGLMHQFGMLRATQVVKALRLRGVETLLDLGGGSGAYSIAFARKKPDLRITLFDQTAVIPIARRYVSEAGVSHNFTFVSGDMTRDDFGREFDLVLISSVCHQFSPGENRALLKKTHRALRPDGQLVIHDFVLNNPRTGPMHAALFAVNMLVNTEGGNSYTVDEYCGWLKTAGFSKIIFRRLAGDSDVVIGRK